MTSGDVSATVRAVSALRAACLRLPHLATPAEMKRLRRFAWLVDHPDAVTGDDCDAVAAGWRQWWRDGRWRAIGAMAAALPPSLVAGDLRLATYALAAELSGER